MGVSYSHNGAACLLRGDSLVVAIQEERVAGLKRTRLDHYQTSLAVAYCLAHAGIKLRDLDMLVACEFSSPVLAPAALREPPGGPPARYLSIPHHLGHAHAVMATSGFSSAGILVIDGQGGTLADLPLAERANVRHAVVPGQQRETEIISIYRAGSTGIELVEKHVGDWMPAYRPLTPASGTGEPRSMYQFGSLGGLFAAVSTLVFGDAMEAGKVMGLAPYGRVTIPADEFFTVDADGCFHFHDRVPAAYRDLAPWPANQELYADLAASTQAALETGVLALATRTRTLTGEARLCYAGGVALNSVTNERLCTELGFEGVAIMPAAEDSGPAIGAAYHGLAVLRGAVPPPRRHARDSTGRPYLAAECAAAIARVPYLETIPADDVLEATVELLCQGAIVGWFEGGSELGPRALGQRSILCDPRPPDAKARLNDRVKHREGFRPFAPAILAETVPDWFDVRPGWGESPHMLRVAPFRPTQADRVPAVVHVDGTGRVQTVTANDGRLHALIARFAARTGVPLLLNTSFNVAGEPIVETPEDALWALLAVDLDAVCVEGTLIRRRRDFTSLLAVVPRVRAHRLRFDAPIAGTIELGLHPGVHVELVTATPHGPLTVPVRASDMSLLRLCDGTRDGHAVLAALGGTGSTEAAAALVRRLYLLRRCHVLELAAPPAGQPGADRRASTTS